MNTGVQDMMNCVYKAWWTGYIQDVKTRWTLVAGMFVLTIITYNNIGLAWSSLCLHDLMKTPVELTMSVFTRFKERRWTITVSVFARLDNTDGVWSWWNDCATLQDIYDEHR